MLIPLFLFKNQEEHLHKDKLHLKKKVIKYWELTIPYQDRALISSFLLSKTITEQTEKILSNIIPEYHIVRETNKEIVSVSLIINKTKNCTKRWEHNCMGMSERIMEKVIFKMWFESHIGIFPITGGNRTHSRLSEPHK